MQHNIDVKKHLFAVAAALRLLLALPFSGRGDTSWETNLKKAQEQANSSNKLVFLDFTGSDWCGWCMKLKREVFITPEFDNYARSNLVLLEIDLPHGKPLSPEQLAANMRVQEQYAVEGFPTLIVLNHEGQEIWRLPSYADAKPADWIRMFEALRAKAGLLPPTAGTASAPSPPPPEPKKS